MPRPALADEIILETVIEPFSIQRSAEVELEILKLILPIADLAQDVLAVAEQRENVLLRHDAIDVLIEFLVVQIQEIHSCCSPL